MNEPTITFDLESPASCRAFLKTVVVKNGTSSNNLTHLSDAMGFRYTIDEASDQHVKQAAKEVAEAMYGQQKVKQ